MIGRRMLAGLPLLGLAKAARAQPAPWPNRPIRLVIPWPPGQSTDVGGRVVAQLLGERLGQTIVPENRPGAGGAIGADAVAKAAPDGNTLLAASPGPILFNPLLQRLPYDVDRDLVPVVLFAISPYLLLVKPDFPAADLHAFMALLRAEPGRYTHSSSGVAGSQHLVTALFLAQAGLEALHVPFQGSAPATAALLGGQVDFSFDTPAAAMGLVRQGSLRALGLSVQRESPVAPGVPPISRLVPELASFDVGGWLGLMAPTGTPPAVLARIMAETSAIAATPVLAERLAQAGNEVFVRGPEEFAALIRSQRDTFGPLIRRLGIRAE
jgi:tripartite-type tricarboxylate transporter receptor subunit TctC